jgi:hypothetical protein
MTSDQPDARLLCGMTSRSAAEVDIKVADVKKVAFNNSQQRSMIVPTGGFAR